MSPNMLCTANQLGHVSQYQVMYYYFNFLAFVLVKRNLLAYVLVKNKFLSICVIILCCKQCPSIMEELKNVY